MSSQTTQHLPTDSAPAYGVGTAASKLVERKAGSPTGAWRPGDDPGGRRFLEIGDLPLESGEVLPSGASWRRRAATRQLRIAAPHRK